MYFNLDFCFDFEVEQQFDCGYFEDGMAFQDGCFEEKVEFCKMRKHIGDFG